MQIGFETSGVDEHLSTRMTMVDAVDLVDVVVDDVDVGGLSGCASDVDIRLFSEQSS